MWNLKTKIIKTETDADTELEVARGTGCGTDEIGEGVRSTHFSCKARLTRGSEEQCGDYSH